MIGAGFIGQLAHLMNYVEIKGCKVVALAEFRPELRNLVCQRYQIPRGYATHTELLQDTEVEAVIVVTPRPQTGPVVLDCLKAGKHVLSEKPMAGTVAQGHTLLAACPKAALYAVGYMKRYDEGVQAAKKILDQLIKTGELGPVTYVRSHCFTGNSYCNADGHVVTEEKVTYESAGWPTAPDWLPEDLHRAYAVYLNTYSHNTNLLRYLFNETPQIEYTNLSVEAGQVAALAFSTFNAVLETGKFSNRGWDEVTEIFFTDGRLIIHTPPALLKNVPARVELYRAGICQEIMSPQINWTWAFRRQAQAFVDDCFYPGNSLISGAEAIKDLEFVENLWKTEASRRGKA